MGEVKQPSCSFHSSCLLIVCSIFHFCVQQQADGRMVNLPPPPPFLLNEHTPVMKTGRLNL